MNRFTYNLCNSWAENAKSQWVGAAHSAEHSRYNGAIDVVADREPDETTVLIDSLHLSDETVAAFRRGDAQDFMGHLFVDALNRGLSRLLKSMAEDNK